MKINSKKIIFTILPIALGVFLIWYSLSKLKPNDIEAIKTSFKTANYWWVACSLFLGILSHLSRAYRWQFMLDPLGYKPKFANNVMAVLVAYLVNLIVPRAGEIARATTVAKYENIPFEKAFGTIADANITTLIAAIILFGFGTGPIQGFAVTLSIGIVTSMFTAIFGTRAIINLIYGRKAVTRLAI